MVAAESGRGGVVATLRGEGGRIATREEEQKGLGGAMQTRGGSVSCD
jgi:hypothetical protein